MGTDLNECSFCGKAAVEVAIILCSRGVRICDECVETAVHALFEIKVRGKTPREPSQTATPSLPAP